MKDGLYILPSPIDDSYVSLSKQKLGRLFRKQILKMNSEFIHPNDPNTKIKVDKALADSLVKNFNEAGQIVQLPLVNDANQHVEGPDKNLGEVLGIDYDDKGIYVTLDARKRAEDFGKTLLGASAFMSLNHKDTITGEYMGPTLYHVAVTNRPYIPSLEDYSEVMSLSADTKDEEAILMSFNDNNSEQVAIPPVEEIKPPLEEKEDPMETLGELLALLKEKHNIDVPALQELATQATELSAKLEDVTSELKLSAETAISLETVGTALIELSAANDVLTTEIKTLKEDRDSLKLSAAESEVDGLISAGRVLPKQKDVMVKLSLTDRETFEALIPDTAIVKLSESGVTVHEEPAKTHDETIAYYKSLADKLNGPKNR